MYTFLRFPGNKIMALTLSYDDSTEYDKKLVDIINKYGIKCTFNVNAGLEGVGRRMMLDEAIQVYKNGGHEVAAHGYKHISLTHFPVDQQVYELMKDKEVLEEKTGCIIKGMAYANGSANEESADVVRKCGFGFARTTVSTEKFDIPSDFSLMPATCHHKNPRLMELADKFLNTQHNSYIWANKPRLFYLWGHAHEFNGDNNWEILEEFCKKVGNRDDVWYATNGEIYDYVMAYKSLRYSANGKIIYNPTNTDVYLCIYDKDYVVKKGETIKID